MNDGERRVIAFLRERLPDGYTIMPNREIAEPGGQSFDYDAIIVAPHAVYALEIKDWRGRILGDEREWLVNDDTRPSPLLATQRKARVLNSKLTAHTPALGRIWVEAVVVMASEPEELELTPEVARRVFRLNALAGFLTDPAGVGQRPEAIKNLSGHVVRALTERLRGRAGPLVFGSYEVVETIEQGDEETWYRARHRLMPKLPPVRLRVVTLSSYNLTPQQRSERLNTVRREAEACFRMGSHPNIVAVREMFDDPHAPGRLVLVLDDTHGRTLRRRLLDGTPMTLQERLDLLVDLCRALAHAHAHGVIHRQVEPRSILIDDDGTARLTRFGLSKFLEGGEATVWLEDVRADLDLRYLAPELLLPGLGDPTPATDLYELGCIAYELFTGKPPFDSPQQALAGPRPSPDGIPPELIEMLSRLLAGEPGQRPQSAKDVLAVLQGLSDTDASRPVTGAKDRYDSGDLIDGKFEVRQPLGTGGFSSVYRVYWAIEDREYALKVFSATAAYDKVKREIELLRGIDHPRIVHAVWADQTRAGQWYLVTELLRGEPLTAYAEGEKRLSVQEAITYTCQLLSALEAIHPNARRIAELKATGNLTMEEYTELQELEAQGIVHRDIKPQNLMLTDRGIVLIDFNIASRVGQPIMTLSGTPPYQAPDIMAASFAAWDVSPDLFATGVVLYELLCNEHPYESSQPRVDLRPRDPRSFRPELSAELAGFLLKACAPFRDQRFATAREMRVALEGIEFPIVLPHSVGTQGLARSLADLIERHPPNVNPMVREFLALSSQARRSNSGTRGIDDLSLQTYVSTRLDAELSDP
ncbi:MAG: methylation-associated defense system protein kinase MAD6, partial [Dehalococcoidia bacterium]